jgi:hypothetical protein
LSELSAGALTRWGDPSGVANGRFLPRQRRRSALLFRSLTWPRQRQTGQTASGRSIIPAGPRPSDCLAGAARPQQAIDQREAVADAIGDGRVVEVATRAVLRSGRRVQTKIGTPGQDEYHEGHHHPPPLTRPGQRSHCDKIRPDRALTDQPARSDTSASNETARPKALRTGGRLVGYGLRQRRRRRVWSSLRRDVRDKPWCREDRRSCRPPGQTGRQGRRG